MGEDGGEEGDLGPIGVALCRPWRRNSRVKWCGGTKMPGPTA